MRNSESAHLSTGNEPNARRAAIEPSVAIIVLHFNTPELTDGLAGYLREELDFPRRRVYVVDNGSAMPCRTATHHFPANLGFTRGMYEAFQIARRDEPWDAYWFLNSDIGFEHGNCVLRELVRVLFSNERHGQIAPQHNSPHQFMERAYSEAQAVPYLEPIATLIKASTIERVGFWELELTHGWGVDYDYGHRVRARGLRNVLTNRARVTHKQHRSIADFGAFVAAAQAEMHAVLSRKYGTDWGRITSLDGPIVPVILTCDRGPSTFPDFVESFETVRDTVAPPVVIVDISASCRLSAAHIALVGQLAPRSVFIHSRLAGASQYDSVQDGACFALQCALQETGSRSAILFIEDDVVFSSHFPEALRSAPRDESVGFFTFYLPGMGFGGDPVPSERFYGTQCVLFPRSSVELLIENYAQVSTEFPPGYDIRWSRFLAAQGRQIRAPVSSYVQHLGVVSRLHGNRGSHQSACFLG